MSFRARRRVVLAAISLQPKWLRDAERRASMGISLICFFPFGAAARPARLGASVGIQNAFLGAGAHAECCLGVHVPLLQVAVVPLLGCWPSHNGVGPLLPSLHPWNALVAPLLQCCSSLATLLPLDPCSAVRSLLCLKWVPNGCHMGIKWMQNGYQMGTKRGPNPHQELGFVGPTFQSAQKP